MRRADLIANVAAGGVAAALLLGAACAPTRKDLRSGNPLDRARAVVALAEQRDAQAIPKLVDLLDDRDPGVRLYTIQALERLTGESFGYRYFDGPADRAAAVQRWRDALRAGEVHLRGAAAADAGAGP